MFKNKIIKRSLPKEASTLSGIVLIVATGVGGGMFSLPIVMAGVWFSWGSLVLVLTSIIMLLTALMLVEVHLHYDSAASFDTFTKDLLGNKWSIFVGLALGFVLYILTYAYMSGSSSVLSQTFINYFDLDILPSWCVVFISVLIIFIVSCSSMLVGRITTILLVGKFVAFFMTFSGLVPLIELDKLLDTANNSIVGTYYLPFIFVVFPFCILSFGFHGSVPSVVKHFNKNINKTKRAIIWGTCITLFLYLFWLAITMGNISRVDFIPIIGKGGNIDVFVEALNSIVDSKYMTVVLTFFGNFAVASSLLAATLGLFDYIADLFHFKNDFLGRLKTACVTYIPPALVCFFFPNGFIYAIGYAGLAFTLWGVILPAFLVKKSRQKYSQSLYRAPCNNLVLNLIIFYGGMVYVMLILELFGCLPAYR
ncbi:aromatic amino acid transporter [Orbaceae bacterium ac157xtp]